VFQHQAAQLFLRTPLRLNSSGIVAWLHFQNPREIGFGPESYPSGGYDRGCFDFLISNPGLQCLAGDTGSLCNFACGVESPTHFLMVLQFDSPVKMKVRLSPEKRGAGLAPVLLRGISEQ
jgi:hypothetical protein